MSEISAIPVFLAVIEEKSFSRAAEKLGITTSAVSRRISALEKHLGVKLLNRTTRSLDLTESGERYFEYARQALMAATDAENAAKEKKDVPSGTLRISTPVTLGRLQLARLAPIFLEQHPQVNIQITMSDVFTKVDPDEFDIILSVGDIPSTNYKATKILDNFGAVVASPDYLKKHGTPTCPEDLAQHNCLLPSFQLVPDEWVFMKDDEEVKIKVTGNYFCNNPEGVKISTLGGLGISCLPLPLLREEIRQGTLVPLLTDYELPRRALRAFYQDKHFLPAKVKVFIDFLINNLEHLDIGQQELNAAGQRNAILARRVS